MPTKTKIEWTDFTSNPIRFRDQRGQSAWGCVKTSPGCAHCYAETIAGRWKRGGPFTAATMATLTPQLDMTELWALLRSKPITGRRVFVGDMTDIFGDWVPDAFLDVLLVVMAYRHDVTFQLLTKRADRMAAYFAGVGADTASWRERWDVARRVVRDQFSMALKPHQRASEYVGVAMAYTSFPLTNLHVGVSCEDQRRADERIPLLLQTPAAVRFVSAEPLLGRIDLSHYLPVDTIGGVEMETWPGWVIVGGESGHRTRPCDVSWIRALVQQCQAAALPVFVKQLGSASFTWDSAEPTGRFRTNPETGKRQMELKYPKLRDRKGGDPSEWPSDLRVRQFPSEGRS